MLQVGMIKITSKISKNTKKWAHCQLSSQVESTTAIFIRSLSQKKKENK